MYFRVFRIKTNWLTSHDSRVNSVISSPSSIGRPSYTKNNDHSLEQQKKLDSTCNLDVFRYDYLRVTTFHPLRVHLNQFKAAQGNLFLVQFTIQMWYPGVEEAIQLIGAILRDTKPEFRTQLILAIRHDIGGRWNGFANWFAHTQTQIQWWIGTSSSRTWNQF